MTAFPELLNSTSLTTIDPRLMTAAERAQGRFLRAPDHDATTGGDTGGGEGDAAGGADEGDAGGKADDGGTDDAGDKGADEGADGGDDASLMGKAGESEGEKDEGDKADEPRLPEKYDLTAPEGLEISDEIIAEVDPVFRELGLDNEQANKVIALAGPFAQRIQQASVDAHLATAAQWAKDAKADPEIGKANWAETESLVAKALDHFVGPKTVKGDDGKETPNAFRQLLDETKLGNHPEMIRAFRKIGAAISEDTSFVRSDAAAPEKKSREEILYPNDAPKKEVSA